VSLSISCTEDDEEEEEEESFDMVSNPLDSCAGTDFCDTAARVATPARRIVPATPPTIWRLVSVRSARICRSASDCVSESMASAISTR